MISLIKNRYVRWLVVAVVTVLIGILLIVWFWRPGTLLKQYNAGHQLGGDLYDEIPGNTIAVFRRAIADLEQSPDYKYSECDLRETKDHRIVVFHNWDIGSLVPDNKENRAALGLEHVESIPIRDLTLSQLQSLRLRGGHRIPTLEEVLQCAAELEIKKPLLLEIKVLHSNVGRNHVIDLAKKYRDSHDIEIHFLAFRRNISRSFPKPERWLKRFSEAGFRVYQVYRPKSKAYDLCENW